MKQTTTSVLNFKGRLTFERIGILLNDLKSTQELNEIQPVVYKKLLTLMIEVLENVLKYADHFEDFIVINPSYLPDFELKQNGQDYILISRNPVLHEHMEAISQKIDRLNAADEETLKKIYRETITNGMFTDKGGAGLGLIEMAKIATGNLEYKFESVHAQYSIFELIIHVNDIEPTSNG